MTGQDVDPFDIPDWMRRAPEDQPRRRRRRRVKIIAVKPKGKRWDRAVRYRVDIGPNHPGFPAGRRIVLALIGRKWVYINHRNKHTRLARTEWNQLKGKDPLPS